MFVKIETERLIIRDFRKEDLRVLLKQRIEPMMRDHILLQKSDRVYSREEFETALAWARYPYQRQYYQLAVVLKSHDSLIGTCGIYEVFPDSTASMGWHYQSVYAGNGYATEAARELLYIGFEINRAALIYAECFEDNRASIRIMEKLGMSPDYSLGNIYRLNGNGENKPIVRHRILRQEWLTQER